MDFTPQQMEQIVRELKKDTTGTGYFSGSGVQSIYIDPAVKLLYPIFYPNLQRIPHIQPSYGGQGWGGLSFQWKAIVDPNAGNTPINVSEGNRNAILQQTLASYSAPYVSMGADNNVSFEEQEFAKGLDNPMDLARLGTVHTLLKQYDIMTTNGNSGTTGVGGTNGFVLGTAPTPVLGATAATGGTIADATKITIFAVELTASGVSYNQKATINPVTGACPVSVTGLASTVSRTPANNSTAETIALGVGHVGLVSNSVTTGSTGSNTNTVACVINATAGAFGWGIYVSINASPTTANAAFLGVSLVPTFLIRSVAVSTNQKASATSLQTDFSYNNSTNATGGSDFDGAFSYIIGSLGSARPATYVQGAGASLHGTGFGTEANIDAAIAAQFVAYNAVPDRLVVGTSMIDPLTNAVQSGGSNSNLRLNVSTDANGRLTSGQVLQSYRVKFSPDGMPRVLDVEVSPNIPANAIWLPTMRNPFPTTSATVPNALALAELKPFYSLNYAFNRRTYEMGSYVQSTLVNFAPQLGILMVGFAPSIS